METITRLQQSFSAWQSSSSKKRYSNASLRKQAVKCLEHYSQEEVSKATGMSVNTLRLWKKSYHRNQEVIDSPSGFVTISLDHEQHADETRDEVPLTLQISLPGGILIKVESTSMVQSVAFIVALNKESHSCSI